jgi:hypothetical protein
MLKNKLLYIFLFSLFFPVIGYSMILSDSLAKSDSLISKNNESFVRGLTNVDCGIGSVSGYYIGIRLKPIKNMMVELSYGQIPTYFGNLWHGPEEERFSFSIYLFLNPTSASVLCYSGLSIAYGLANSYDENYSFHLSPNIAMSWRLSAPFSLLFKFGWLISYYDSLKDGTITLRHYTDWKRVNLQLGLGIPFWKY